MDPEYISVYAPTHLDPYDSYGLIGCELVRHLSRLGAYVNAIAIGNPRHSNQDEEIAELTGKPIHAIPGGLLLGYPTLYDRYGELANLHPKIAITMFESSRLPKGWVDALNVCDAVITPSSFCYNIFRDAGVTAPIHVIPLGVAEVYKRQRRDLNRPFTFLAFMDRGRRKGGLTALEAFATEFYENPQVRLVLKVLLFLRGF